MLTFEEFCNESVSKNSEELFTKSNPTLNDFKKAFEASFGHNHYNFADLIYDASGYTGSIKAFVKEWFGNEDHAVGTIVDGIEWNKKDANQMKERDQMEASVRGFCHLVDMNEPLFVKLLQQEVDKKNKTNENAEKLKVGQRALLDFDKCDFPGKSGKIRVTIEKEENANGMIGFKYKETRGITHKDNFILNKES